MANGAMLAAARVNVSSIVGGGEGGDTTGPQVGRASHVVVEASGPMGLLVPVGRPIGVPG